MEREGVQKVWWEKGDEKDARKNGNVFFLSRLRISVLVVTHVRGRTGPAEMKERTYLQSIARTFRCIQQIGLYNTLQQEGRAVLPT
jgi:hypothetical protein